ncbi:ribonucleoside-diphosphate reductase [Streptomyces sp. TG1A-8]|uniref:TSCPD domain-containing protein n=1 Tax=Streptomyces sp. TG1A-8 TaxID=3051385 RepID=UPI00265C620F|nr:ribonucleoside-diphosphate reductase [Streptomyces sp. TG1A-8]MDO0930110.1 ribonucleoside-diphosphate reductase [Streptomyces sp. TG1A-8]
MAERFGDGTTLTRSDDQVGRPAPQRPPRRMKSTTRSFTVGEGKGYLTVACTTDGVPAEVMIRMVKQGSTLAGMMDAFSSTITRGLQHGVPLEVFVREYVGMRFEPAGLTNDPEIRQVSSVMDYVGRRLALDYLPYDVRVGLNVLTAEERATKVVFGGDIREAAPAGARADSKSW